MASEQKRLGIMCQQSTPQLNGKGEDESYPRGLSAEVVEPAIRDTAENVVCSCFESLSATRHVQIDRSVAGSCKP